MKMISNLRFLGVLGMVSVAGVFSLYSYQPAQARTPFSKQVLATQQEALLTVVKKGDDLWHDAKLGTNGLACANCHPDAAAVNPHTFPKFQPNLGKVSALREMVNWCILVPLEGNKLKDDSEEMIALEAYAYYMHRGFKLTPGENALQHPAVKVRSGPGYP